MWIMAAGVRAAGIEVVVEGMEHVPAGRSCIFLANHVSNLDPPVLLPMLPGRTSVLLKRSLMRIPILGTAMRMAGFVPVDRGSSRVSGPEAAAASVAAAAEALRAGLHILIYPEGTRSGDGRLAKFKKGPFLPGVGLGGADHSGGDSWNGGDDAEGDALDPAGGGDGADAGGDRSGGLWEQG